MRRQAGGLGGRQVDEVAGKRMRWQAGGAQARQAAGNVADRQCDILGNPSGVEEI
jgi:hypothetical protein